MSGHIYVIQCCPTGKSYVGQTTHDSIERRWKEHKACARALKRNPNDKNKYSCLYKAMVKYGIDQFDITLWDTVPIEQLNDLEIEFIKDFDTLVPNGYNLTSGGDSNYKHSKQTIENMKKTKHERIENVRNDKLEGLPPYTAYRKNAKGEQILVNGHPLCNSKTFTYDETKYDSFEQMKRDVCEFISKLEESGIEHKVDKRGGDLPKGVLKITGGYRVNKVFKGRSFDKRFRIKSISDDENRINAFKYYNEVLDIIEGLKSQQ